MLIDEENIMLEASVEVGFETELSNNWIMMTINVGVDTIHAFKNLADHARERLGKWHACIMLEADEGTLRRDEPILLGNTASLSILLWTQPIRCSMYLGAGIFVGRL
jgi:hypothetical protein